MYKCMYFALNISLWQQIFLHTYLGVCIYLYKVLMKKNVFVFFTQSKVHV